MSRIFEPAPRRCVEHGVQLLGTYAAPLDDVNLIDAQWSPPLPKRLRGFRLKEWQAVQLINERWFAFVALFDAKLISLVQVKLYDRVERKKYVFEKKVLSGAFENPRQVRHSNSTYRGGGTTVGFENRLDDGYFDIDLDIAASAGRPSICGRVRAQLDPGSLHVASWPFGRGRGAVSHKGIFTATGELMVGDESVVFAAPSGVAFLDHHKGSYPYVMRWDWMTTGGVVDGRRIGLNLTRNASTDPERYNENVVWCDGTPHLLPPVTFERTAGTPERWHARDAAGRVDVGFEVDVDGRVEVNALVIRSRYRGPFGRFSGSVALDDGSRVSLDGLFGMAEDFYLRC